MILARDNADVDGAAQAVRDGRLAVRDLRVRLANTVQPNRVEGTLRALKRDCKGDGATRGRGRIRDLQAGEGNKGQVRVSIGAVADVVTWTIEGSRPDHWR